MADLVPTCVWRLTPALLLALDERFGMPDDAYVNGSQVWLRDEGEPEIGLEWRLHPVPGFVRPKGIGTYEMLDTIVWALRGGEDLPVPLDALWEGLEAFPGYGDEIEPAPLAALCAASLGIAPDAFGVVDHQVIGDEWERTEGKHSVIDAIFAQLALG